MKKNRYLLPQQRDDMIYDGIEQEREKGFIVWEQMGDLDEVAIPTPKIQY